MIQATVSPYWNVVSPRPCGKPVIPPNDACRPRSSISGKTPEGEVIPKVDGFAMNAWLKIDAHPVQARRGVRWSIVGEKMCV